MIKCVVSQTGRQIRKDIKEVLSSKAGWQEKWKVNWVTDGESKQLNATDPTNMRL